MLVPLVNNTQARAHCIPLPPKMAGGIVLQMDQAAFTNNEIFGYNNERSQNTNLYQPLYETLQILSLSMFEKTPINQLICIDLSTPPIKWV